jgi:enamine deaminase RidA (YjgF/YER057c/UK114 family)
MSRQLISSGTPWEASVGYSRAVRVGNQIFVSGTTASDEAGQTVSVGDAYGQTQFILRKIESALKEAGADLTDIVRTRFFVTDISRWEEIGKAHGEVFATIRPAATMVEVSRLTNPDHLVEIEIDAVLMSLSGRVTIMPVDYSGVLTYDQPILGYPTASDSD